MWDQKVWDGAAGTTGNGVREAATPIVIPKKVQMVKVIETKPIYRRACGNSLQAGVVVPPLYFYRSWAACEAGTTLSRPFVNAPASAELYTSQHVYFSPYLVISHMIYAQSYTAECVYTLFPSAFIHFISFSTNNIAKDLHQADVCTHDLYY